MGPVNNSSNPIFCPSPLSQLLSHDRPTSKATRKSFKVLHQRKLEALRSHFHSSQVPIDLDLSEFLASDPLIAYLASLHSSVLTTVSNLIESNRLRKKVSAARSNARLKRKAEFFIHEFLQPYLILESLIKIYGYDQIEGSL